MLIKRATRLHLRTVLTTAHFVSARFRIPEDTCRCSRGALGCYGPWFDGCPFSKGLRDVKPHGRARLRFGAGPSCRLLPLLFGQNLMQFMAATTCVINQVSNGSNATVRHHTLPRGQCT